MQNRLANLAASQPDRRLRELEAFAHEQTPRIAALEREAEQLRIDLRRGGLIGAFWGSGDWNEHRNWRLSAGGVAARDPESLRRAFQVLRAAVFYQEGISPAQRRLVREIAMEVQVQAFERVDMPSETGADALLTFFSPETARIRMPENLSPELATRIAGYTREKSALKDELRDALIQQDAAAAPSRAATLRKLAVAQEPRIQALEEMAEQIRRELAVLETRESALTQLPRELAARVVAWQHDWRTMQEAIASKLAEINRSYGFEAVNFIREPDNVSSTITLRAKIRPSAMSEEIKYRIQATVAAFNRESAQRTVTLKREAESLRAEIAAHAATHPQTLGGRSTDEWWKHAIEALQEEDDPAPYREYRTAVFEPGLSPEQRRLLFAAAVRELRLPLPGGEFQP